MAKDPMPMPTIVRHARKDHIPVDAADSMPATDTTATPAIAVFRRPYLSESGPASVCACGMRASGGGGQGATE
jgi:hypothetical protein